jgi:hypothetical protein
MAIEPVGNLENSSGDILPATASQPAPPEAEGTQPSDEVTLTLDAQIQALQSAGFDINEIASALGMAPAVVAEYMAPASAGSSGPGAI